MTSRPRIHVAVNRAELEPIFDQRSWAELTGLGEVSIGPDLDRVSLPHGVSRDYDVVVTSWCTEPFTAEELGGERLRLVAHAGGSVRGLFPRELLGGEVRLVQCGSDAMAEPVAEMAIALALALVRNLHSHDRRLQASRHWQNGGHGELGRSLRYLCNGIVGLSRTGQHYARMLRGLGAEDVIAYDPFWTEQAAARLGVRLVTLSELCADSDVLAVHAPATLETIHMLSREQLAALPDGAVLINTARSALVDQEALLAELVSGRISAGLDVFDEEPLPADSPFFGLPNALITPHVAGGTRSSRREQGRTIVREIGHLLRGEAFEHEVTPEIYDQLA